jgi:hypothetical protein
MKRNMDLIRSIMLHLETYPDADLGLTEVQVDGFSEDMVLGHLVLLGEAGFIDLNVEHFLGGEPPHYIVHRITWAGHEFLEAVRSQTIWAKSTKMIASAGVGMAWPLLQAVLRAKAAEHLGIQL